MMQLMYHGGLCCGIKTVCHMGVKPSETHYELNAAPTKDINDGGGTSKGERWYREARPHETGAKRLDAYIEFYEKSRKKGILECVVATFASGLTYQDAWIPHLLSRGFVETFSYENSNSGGNIIHIFHKKIGEPSTPLVASEGD